MNNTHADDKGVMEDGDYADEDRDEDRDDRVKVDAETSPPPPMMSTMHVHRSVLEAFQSIEPELTRLLNLYDDDNGQSDGLEEEGPLTEHRRTRRKSDGEEGASKKGDSRAQKHLLFTGHSGGGALAQIAAAYYSPTPPSPPLVTNDPPSIVVADAASSAEQVEESATTTTAISTETNSITLTSPPAAVTAEVKGVASAAVPDGGALWSLVTASAPAVGDAQFSALLNRVASPHGGLHLRTSG